MIGLGEPLSGQIVAKALKTILQQPQMPPSCWIVVPDDSGCLNGGDGYWTYSDPKPCPGDFSFNSTFPVQEGEVVLINYTVRGEQRFYDFWSETAPARGYNVSC